MTLRLPIRFVRMLSATAFALAAMLLPLRPALAADYTDLWVTPGEDAWGVNFVQWGNIIFATFYIYGPDNKPVWYTAVLDWDGASKYAGTLFSERGTYFGLPWNPGDMNEQAAGLASFTPSTTNNYQGTLAYSVNGTPVTNVNKSITRLTVASVPLAGTYFGGQVGAYSNCSANAYSDTFQLQVTQSAGNNISLTFAFTSKLTCTLAGTLAQNGLLYGVANASYLCSDQTDTTAAVTDLKVTTQGIEGHLLAAPNAHGAGCQEDARFSAVRN